MSAIHLRDWRPADAGRLALVADDPELGKWSQLAQLGPDRWIAQQRSGDRGPSLAVGDDADNRLLGKVALRLPGRASAATAVPAIWAADQPAGELSFWVIGDARGRGVATAATLAMIDIARDLGTMRSVVLDIELENAASIRVATRIGAQPRATTRVERDRQGVARTLRAHVLRL